MPAEPASRVVGEVQAQAGRDLLLGPALGQPLLDVVTQDGDVVGGGVAAGVAGAQQH